MVVRLSVWTPGESFSHRAIDFRKRRGRGRLSAAILRRAMALMSIRL